MATTTTRRPRSTVVLPEGGVLRTIGEDFSYQDPSGEYHRADGPAIRRPRGNGIREEWRHHGLLHRTDGPALLVVEEDGGEWCAWYILGVRCDREAAERFAALTPAAQAVLADVLASSPRLADCEDGAREFFTPGPPGYGVYGCEDTGKLVVWGVLADALTLGEALDAA